MGKPRTHKKSQEGGKITPNHWYRAYKRDLARDESREINYHVDQNWLIKPNLISGNLDCILRKQRRRTQGATEKSLKKENIRLHLEILPWLSTYNIWARIKLFARRPVMRLLAECGPQMIEDVAHYNYAAAAAAKSLQSCPTLCDPTDGSPPGSPVPGILQARTLEWVAISFSNA